MWQSVDTKPTNTSENSHVHDMWWANSGTQPDEDQVEAMFDEYLDTGKSTDLIEEGVEGKTFKERFTKLQSPRSSNSLPGGLSFEATQSPPTQSESTQQQWIHRQTSNPSTDAAQTKIVGVNSSTANNARTSTSVNKVDEKANAHPSPNPIIHLQPPLKPTSSPAPELSSPALTITSNYNIKHLKPTKRAFSAIQRYRHLDERQSKRAPLWKRRVNFKGDIPDKSDMLATAPNHSYDLGTVNELMSYQSPHMHSYMNDKASMSATRTSNMPLSPSSSSSLNNRYLAPSSARAQYLGHYNLSTESLPSYHGQGMNTLSRPHSMPHLQDQPELAYDGAQSRYMHHQSSSEYLSQSENFDDELLHSHSISSLHGFAAPYPISESLELDTSGSAASSVQGSSPQPWWDSCANLEVGQETPSIYPSTTPSILPTMTPKRPEQFSSMMYMQQPGSPLMSQEKIYTNLMDRTQSTQSSIPSPPVSPYFFSPAMSQDGYFGSVESNGVPQFVDPFNQQGEMMSNNMLRSPVVGSNYDMTPKSPNCKGHTIPTMLHSSVPVSRHLASHRPSYGRKGTTSSLASSRVPSLSSASRMSSVSTVSSRHDKEMSFVNFTPGDATKILSGVAPSGSSKTKARREREALERRRKLSEAAATAIIAAGGDPASFHLEY